MYSPVVWKIKGPPRVQIFLWLLSNNRTLTRDNLSKKKSLNDKSCLYCVAVETVSHLFFGCYVASVVWESVSALCGMHWVQNLSL